MVCDTQYCVINIYILRNDNLKDNLKGEIG